MTKKYEVELFLKDSKSVSSGINSAGLGISYLSAKELLDATELISHHDDEVLIYFASEFKGKYHKLVISYENKNDFLIEYMTPHIYSKVIKRALLIDLLKDSERFCAEYFLNQGYNQLSI